MLLLAGTMTRPAAADEPGAVATPLLLLPPNLLDPLFGVRLTYPSTADCTDYML